VTLESKKQPNQEVSILCGAYIKFLDSSVRKYDMNATTTVFTASVI